MKVAGLWVTAAVARRSTPTSLITVVNAVINEVQITQRYLAAVTRGL